MGLNYYDTFIEVAGDCPAIKGEIPQLKGGKKTQAVLEYEMIANNPYRYTEEDVSFETFAIRHGVPKAQWPEIFGRRSSMLTRFGTRQALRLGHSQRQGRKGSIDTD